MIFHKDNGDEVDKMQLIFIDMLASCDGFEHNLHACSSLLYLLKSTVNVRSFDELFQYWLFLAVDYIPVAISQIFL